MIGLLKLRTRKFFDDLALGMKLFAKGKLNLFPDYVKGNAEVRKLIKESLAQSKQDASSGNAGVSPAAPSPGHGGGH
jgi:hypothetical protein